MTPQKKAIWVGLILAGGILLALPFRHSSPPESENSSQRVARDVWLKTPARSDDEKQADDQEITQANLTGTGDTSQSDSERTTSLLQDMQAGLQSVAPRPWEPSEDPRTERSGQQPSSQKRESSRWSQQDVGNATLGTELVNLPPDVVVVEKPANQFLPGEAGRTLQSRMSMNQPGAETQERANRYQQSAPKTIRHRVRDGDTIESLAQRYLGDSRRGLEIFNANRGKLQNPKALPIGDELIIIVQ